MKQFLQKTGLSMSQAQSATNLMNQRANDINFELGSVNNYERTIKYNGETLVDQKGSPMPTNIVQLLIEKCTIHACMAFIMSVLKFKDELIKGLQVLKFTHTIPQPEEPEYKKPVLRGTVNEAWGWKQLSPSEYAEYLEKEAFAAHIGKYIHNGGKLDELRKELPHLRTLSWMELKTGEKSPMQTKVHHTQAQLLKLHTELANMHREYESRVNYFKAKVKNLVSQENTDIAQSNANEIQTVSTENTKLRNEFLNVLKIYQDEVSEASQRFEMQRNLDIKEIAALRIAIPAQYQSTLDQYLVKES